MPSLRCVGADRPPHLSGVNYQTLQLTDNLLREHHPQLAKRVGALVHSHSPATQQDKKPSPTGLDHTLILDELGAVDVGKIIAALTGIGNRWLHTGHCDLESLYSLQCILQQWIELGDWIVEHAASH